MLKGSRVLRCFIPSFTVCLTVFSSVLPALTDSALQYSNVSYGYVRKLSQDDNAWTLGLFETNLIDPDTRDVKNQLNEARDLYGFYRSTLFQYLVALNEQKEIVYKESSRNGTQMMNHCLFSLATFCDGNTSKEGELYQIPLQVMFNNNNACDLTISSPDAVSHSYISQEFADRLLDDDETLQTYEDLLGKTYLYGDDVFSINNIYRSDASLAPLFRLRFDDFIIVDDVSYLDQYDLAICSGYAPDIISQNDYIRYFQKKSASILDFCYISNNVVVRDRTTEMMANVISSILNTKFTSSSVFWVMLFLEIVNFLLLWKSIQSRWIGRKLFLILCLIHGGLLFVINIANLFLFGVPMLLNFFNLYLSIHCWVTLLSLLALPILLRKKLVYYEIDI